MLRKFTIWLFLFVGAAVMAGDKHAKAGNGLVAHYYRDIQYWGGYWVEDGKPSVEARFWTFTKYAYSRVEPLVNHSFIRSGWFSIRWQGTFVTSPRKSKDDVEADYVFHIWADDGCRLYIDGKKVIDSWRDAWEMAPESHRYTTVRLKPGKHTIAVEYFQGQSLKKNDKDPMKLYWSCKARGIKEQIIPASHFFHTTYDFVPKRGRND